MFVRHHASGIQILVLTKKESTVSGLCLIRQNHNGIGQYVACLKLQQITYNRYARNPQNHIHVNGKALTAGRLNGLKPHYLIIYIQLFLSESILLGCLRMSGIDPYEYMQQVSMRMHEFERRGEIETVLDELEYLFEVIPPEMQDNAEILITLLREKLAYVSEP